MKHLYIFLLLHFLCLSQGWAQRFELLDYPSLPTLSDGEVLSVDVNKDGQWEILLAGKQALSANERLEIYRFQAGQWVKYDNGLPAWDLHAFAVVDANADGFQDLVISGTDIGGDTQTQLFLNQGNGQWQASAVTFPDYQSVSLAQGDFLSQGEQGILMMGQNADSQWVSTYISLKAGEQTALELPAFQQAKILPLGKKKTDLLVVGEDYRGFPRVQYYSNLGQGRFQLQTSFGELSNAQAVLADLNQDGLQDVIVTGYSGSTPLSKIFLQQTNGWQEVAWGLPAWAGGKLLAADFTGNGYMDVFIAGVDNNAVTKANLYLNNDGTALADAGLSFPALYSGALGLADWNADGAADLYFSGKGTFTDEKYMYQNLESASAQLAAPTLSVGKNENQSVSLSWSAVAQATSYDLRIGSSSGANDIFPVPAQANGQRQFLQQGIFSTAFEINQMPEGAYHWAVQAVDAAGKGGAFSEEGEFYSCEKPDLGEDQSLCTGESLTLKAGKAGEVVSWYNLAGDLLLDNSQTFESTISEDITIVVQVVKPSLNHCTVKDTIKIKALDIPVFDIEAVNDICIGTYFSHELTGDFQSVSWFSKTDQKVLSNETSLNHQVWKEEEIELTATNLLGCSRQLTFILKPYNAPLSGLQSAYEVCEGTSLNLSPTGDYKKIEWKTSALGDWFKVPSYEYASDQDMTLQLRLTDDTGCSGEESIQITHLPMPSPAIGEDDALCWGTELKIDAGEYEQYQWYQNDAEEVFSSGRVLEWTVDQSVNWRLKVQDEKGCWGESQRQITSLELPDLSAISEVYPVCQGEWLSLNAGDFARYRWTRLSDQLVISTEATVNMQANAEESYQLTVWNEQDCEQSKTFEVQPLSLPDPVLASNYEVCLGSDLWVENVGTFTQYEWYLEGELVHTGTEDHWSANIQSDQLLGLQVTDAQGCQQMKTATIQALALPASGLEAEQFICAQEIIELHAGGQWANVTWERADGSASYEPTLSFAVENAEAVKLTMVDAKACEATEQIQVNTYALPVIDLPTEIAVCAGASFELDAGGGLTRYRWRLDGEIIGTNRVLRWWPAGDQTIELEVQNTAGCLQTHQVQVTVNPLPVITLADEQFACWGDSPTLDAGEWAAVHWQSLQLGDLGTNAQLDYIFEQEDELTLSVTDGNTCSNQLLIRIHPRALPAVDLGDDPSTCYGQKLDLSIPSDLGESVAWILDGQPISDQWSITLERLEQQQLAVEVTDQYGCVGRDELQLNVLNLPVIDLGDDQQVCDGNTFEYTLPNNYAEIKWYRDADFAGDSRFLSFEVAQSQQLKAVVTDPLGCVNADSMQIEKLNLPEFSLGDDQQICDGSSVALTANHENTQSVKWYNVFDGLKGTGTNYEQVINNDETFWAVLQDQAGCQFTDTVKVAVLALPEFTLGEDQQICFGSEVSLQLPERAGNTEWTDIAGQVLGTDLALSYPIEKEEVITARFTDTNGCQFTDQLKVGVLALPDFTLEEEKEVCFDQPAQLFIDGDWQKVEWMEGENVLHEGAMWDFTSERDIPLTARVTSWEGCQQTGEMNFYSLPLPIANAGDDQAICSDQSVQLMAAGESDWTYQWAPALHLSDAKAQQPIASPQQSITYGLVVTDAKGCVSLTDSVTVHVNEFKSVSAGADQMICIGDAVVLETEIDGANFDYEYSWTPATGLSDATSEAPMANPSATTTYQVSVRMGNCIARTDEVTITVNPLPEITISEDIAIGAGQSTTLSASGGAFYLWSPDYRVDNPNTANPTVSPNITTTYTVSVISELGCENTDQVTVHVGNEIFVPNLFSPNDDGQNDHFKIYGKGVKSIRLAIYNAEGKQVFISEKIEEVMEQGWDGQSNGSSCPVGTYYWKLEGKYFDDSPLKFKGLNSGTINLMR